MDMEEIHYDAVLSGKKFHDDAFPNCKCMNKIEVNYIPSEHRVKLWWFKDGKRTGIAEWT